MMRRRVGRPGLVGTMARTAVVAGTATAVAGGMSRHAQQREMDQQQAAASQQEQEAAAAPPPPPPPPAAAPDSTDTTVAKLKELADLHASGVLSDAEFTAAKAKVLG
jgi:Short C-terminal domain